MGSDDRSAASTAALADALGSRVADAAPIPWGDSGTTYRVVLADGRSVAARMIEPGRRTHAERVARAMATARGAGIPVPDPRVIAVGEATWLVTPWVAGDPGARWLDTPERARVVAHAMGALHLAFRAISPQLAPMAFVHGDFAPINVILDADGTVASVLDFERARAGDPLTDVAWWGWVVRHHHPDAWVAAWPTFCAAAGIDPEGDGPTIRTLMLDELALRAAEAPDDLDRQRWLDRLAEATGW